MTPDLAGLRMDKALASHPKVGTRSRALKLLQDGLVLRRGKAVKPSYTAEEGETFQVSLPAIEDQHLKPLDLPLDILFEDKDLLVINKPAGLVVHPAAGHASDTLVNALIHHTDDLAMGFGEERPGIVHRLDKDTSGLLVVAKNDFTQSALAEQFKARTIHRLYWAITHGFPKQAQGRIETTLARHPTDRRKFSSERNHAQSTGRGKRAITHYTVRERHVDGLGLLQCRLETGRTHQIRVHMSELGHPIIGDWLYGAGGRLSGVKNLELRGLLQPMTRIGLHAAELGFTHPREQTVLKFSAPWPADLQPIVELLGWK